MAANESSNKYGNINSYNLNLKLNEITYVPSFIENFKKNTANKL